MFVELLIERHYGEKVHHFTTFQAGRDLVEAPLIDIFVVVVVMILLCADVND